MSLDDYKQKRDFLKTSEPLGYIADDSKEKLIFVVQEHHATHIHWDFRIEYQGVLKSWAIPKEPPTDKNVKRLAIQTEDHPMEYSNFQGEISEGNYGAGTVKIWDKGDYILKKFQDKKIEIKLNGTKLKGNYVLLKTRYGNKPEKSWLFFKVG